MNPEQRFHLFQLLEALTKAMAVGTECNVRFKKGDALTERFVEAALAFLRDAGYAPEDITGTWKANFGK